MEFILENQSCKIATAESKEKSTCLSICNNSDWLYWGKIAANWLTLWCSTGSRTSSGSEYWCVCMATGAEVLTALGGCNLSTDSDADALCVAWVLADVRAERMRII